MPEDEFFRHSYCETKRFPGPTSNLITSAGGLFKKDLSKVQRTDERSLNCSAVVKMWSQSE